MSASTILICIAAFSAAVLIASYVIAKVEGAPDAVDDECSRVDDAVREK